jgi:hypothetical protein
LRTLALVVEKDEWRQYVERARLRTKEGLVSEGPRKRAARPSRGYRLSAAAIAKVSAEAGRLGMTESQYLDGLILQSSMVETDYFAQQAAVQSFVTAALVASLAAKQLGVAETVQLRDRGAALATQLFGAPRRRPGDLDVLSDGGDPRVRALFDAFAPE